MFSIELRLRGPSVGKMGTLFIFDMNYLGHEDLKEKKKKKVVYGKWFSRGGL